MIKIYCIVVFQNITLYTFVWTHIISKMMLDFCKSLLKRWLSVNTCSVTTFTSLHVDPWPLTNINCSQVIGISTVHIPFDVPFQISRLSYHTLSLFTTRVLWRQNPMHFAMLEFSALWRNYLQIAYQQCFLITKVVSVGQ